MPTTPVEHIVALLPPGAEVIAELDLARVRKNAVVGEVAQRVLARKPGDAGARIGVVPGLPALVSGADAEGSPLADADAVVLAAYGVGTAQAATVTVLATHAEVASGRRLSPELVAIGPPDWLDQLATRVAIDAREPLAMPTALRTLRAHAMPHGATGATFRITAQLPFDARVALARQTGVEIAPAQLSVWGDIADDIAIVIDADAADPGEKRPKAAAVTMAKAVERLLGQLAADPSVRALGLPTSLENARFSVGGSWLRVVVTVGPSYLKRVVARANELFPGAT
jgi:hypothetical protein